MQVQVLSSAPLSKEFRLKGDIAKCKVYGKEFIKKSVAHVIGHDECRQLINDNYNAMLRKRYYGLSDPYKDIHPQVLKALQRHHIIEG